MEVLRNSPSPSSFLGKNLKFIQRRTTVTKETYSRLISNHWSASFSTQKLSLDVGKRKLLIAAAKKKKADSHSFVSNPDEATGPFPEAVLLKKREVQKDGSTLPEFVDAEEEKLFEFLNLQLESDLSDLSVERIRHYEVVFLIHEDCLEEVPRVISKVEDFIKEKKGKIWRLNNWGLRRLAYKIKKANYATYILMNFEIEAKWINDFKSMLDNDERVIRHLVIKRDEAITEDCPPPLEFHTLRANSMDDIDTDADADADADADGFDEEEDAEERNDENESDMIGSDENDVNDGIVYVEAAADDEEDTTRGSNGSRKRTLRTGIAR
ncbi:protein REGULATOR OF FATTY ACID COMPOSITION 3, chloroplastic [Aristolochia californica]|uniref:protein REGULATOR OF FATTY ACID COMPOSITION 3, chloroplastic n=1 Tax=Aristolochia californica TaxID=171875 RepID=UPI0035E3B78C